MTIHSLTGFETGNTAECYGSGGTFSVQSSTVKTGGYAVRVNPTTTGTGFVTIGAFSTTNNDLVNLAGNSSPQVAGFWFYAVTLPAANSEQICSFNSGAGANQAALRITNNGKLQLYNADGTTQVGGDSTATISINTWYHIEMNCNAGAAGSRTGVVSVNGATDISTSAGTFASAASEYDVVRIGKGVDRNGQTVDFIYDDIYRSDTSYAANMPRIEQVQVNADGTYTGFSGGTNASNYLEVDESTPDGATTYVQSTAANSASTFNFESSATAGVSGTIHALQFCTWGARVGTGLAHDIRIRSGGSDFDYPDAVWVGSYEIRGRVLIVDPATSVAWTTSGLDAVEAGVEETAASANRVRLSTVWISALFTPAAGGLSIPVAMHYRYQMGGS